MTTIASGTTRHFVRHYLEMVAAMVVGMVVLGAASAALLELPDRTPVTLLEMAIWMTAPMVAWMRVRGHSWRLCNEMAVAMLLPTAGVLALLGAGRITDAGTLMMLEHTVMPATMLVAMLVRRDKYTGHQHHNPEIAT